MSKKKFARGEVVFREGEIGRSFYQILEGAAGIYLHYGEEGERKIAEMMPGQYFGEMGVIEAWPRSATVVAEEDLRVVEITESNLNAFFQENPAKILEIMKQIGSRIRTLTEEYEEVSAFLKEKENAKKDDGFFAKIRKYREISAMAKKNADVYTAENSLRIREFGRPADSPIPVTSYRKGTVIFREGDTGAFMYAIHGGAVGIYANYGSALEKKLTTLYPNSFFGEMSLIDLEPRSATAVADEDDTILEAIRDEDLEKLFETNPVEVDAILSHLSNRLRRLTQDYVRACDAAAEA